MTNPESLGSLVETAQYLAQKIIDFYTSPEAQEIFDSIARALDEWEQEYANDPMLGYMDWLAEQESEGVVRGYEEQ